MATLERLVKSPFDLSVQLVSSCPASLFTEESSDANRLFAYIQMNHFENPVQFRVLTIIKAVDQLAKLGFFHYVCSPKYVVLISSKCVECEI